nr:pepsin/retropepsin-like aspartic protease family protein [Pedobacter sp. ASV2]
MKKSHNQIKHRIKHLTRRSFLIWKARDGFMMFIMILIAVTSQGQVHNSAFKSIYREIKEKNFFKAKDLYNGKKGNLTVEYQYFLEAILDNAFNKTELSNQKILKIENSKTTLPDSLMFKIWYIREDNYLKQYAYKKAKSTVETILSRYKNFLSEEERSDLNNNLKIWTALENVPPQQIAIHGGTRLKIEKDVAGLKNLKIKVGEDSINFIFDTGANISTVSASTAKRLKMKIIPADVDVDAVTGISVKADLAICKKMSLGNVIVKNAVFLVFADSALNFPQINFQINGILGFPVIEALGEVQLTQDDYFIVPETETKINTTSNMAIDGLSPLIYIDGRHYTFDTGADHTILYETYYQENKKDIEDKYPVTKIGMGGAGGKIEYEGFKVNFMFQNQGKQILLENISLLKNKVNKETVYGNIGQDIIRQFHTLTLNFNEMFIKFD